MLPRKHLNRIQITFDDHRLVANAGLILPAILARHLGLPDSVVGGSWWLPGWLTQTDAVRSSAAK